MHSGLAKGWFARNLHSLLNIHVLCISTELAFMSSQVIPSLHCIVSNAGTTAHRWNRGVWGAEKKVEKNLFFLADILLWEIKLSVSLFFCKNIVIVIVWQDNTHMADLLPGPITLFFHMTRDTDLSHWYAHNHACVSLIGRKTLLLQDMYTNDLLGRQACYMSLAS